MEKYFRFVVFGLLAIALIFSASIFSARLGYGNQMVMLWMIAGPVSFWIAVAMLAACIVVHLLKPPHLDVGAPLYLLLGTLITNHLILGWVSSESIVWALLVTLLASLFAVLISRLRAPFLVGVVASVVAITAWLYDDKRLVMVFGAACLIVLAIIYRASEPKE